MISEDDYNQIKSKVLSDLF
ncbi:hypothetical protein [Latilactobacillus sakei]